MSPNARSRFWITTAAVVSSAVTASLGVWQLSRAAEKQALEERIQARALMAPLAGADLPLIDIDSALHRPVRLTGQWQAQASVFLDNRPMGGRSGFILVTPLRLSGGSGESILVQRGWVPRDFMDRNRLPLIPTPEGDVEVSGRLAPPPSRLIELGKPQGGPIRQNLDLDALARETGLSLMPASVLQSGVSHEGLLRDWPRFEAAVHKHHGYAVQWFALCAVITGLYVWFQWISPRRRHSPHGPDTR